MENAFFYAMAANLSFAFASVGLAHFSRKVDSLWMNFFKCLVAFIAVSLTLLATQYQTGLTASSFSIIALMASGIIGLGIGDVFLLKGMAKLGPARTLMIFGIQPLWVGVLAHFIFGQELGLKKLVAIVFFILCLLTMAYENARQQGITNEGVLPSKKTIILIPLLGVLLDGIGVILTRAAFNHTGTLHSWEANFWRFLGPLLFFGALSLIRPFGALEKLKKLTPRDRSLAIIVSFFATYVSLGLFLKAIQIGDLASVAAISITGVLFSSLIEHIIQRKLPSRYFVLSAVFFTTGSYVFFSAY